MCLIFFFSHFRSVLLFLRQPGMFLILSLGSLSNDDSDGNENGKNLDWQNNNFARASRFFVHFYAVAARL